MDKTYGLVFQDIRDNTFNVAVFNTDRTEFVEVYELNTEACTFFGGLGFKSIVFATVEINEGFDIGYLLAFDYTSENVEDATSKDFITSCYDKEINPSLINDTFNSCYAASQNKQDIDGVSVGLPSLDS